MNLTYKHAALAALMVVVCSGASAQRAARNDGADDFAQSVSYATYLKGKDLRASEIVGKRVRNAAGDNLGEINNVIINEKGDVVAVVIGVGGFLGIGEKNVGVPFNELQFKSAEAMKDGTDNATREDRAEQKGDEDEVDRAGAHNLVRDRQVAAARVPDVGDLHRRSVL